MRMFIKLGLFLLLSISAQAQDLPVPGVSGYYCRQLDGSLIGNSCTAPYRPYRGDACSIFEASDATSQVRDFVRNTTNSCSASAVERAKKETLGARASLRRYVTAGRDESVNDPVENTSYRPRGASAGAGEVYFAAECAVQMCSGGSSAPDDPPDGQPDDPAPAPPPPPPKASPPKATIKPATIFEFVVCNETPFSLYVATTSINGISRDLQTRGWVYVAGKTCAHVGYFEVGDFYYHIVNDRWRTYYKPYSSSKFCVWPQPQNFFREANGPCGNGQMRTFDRVVAKQDLKVTITPYD